MALLESNPHHNPLTARHPSTTLLSGPTCVFSHCCRIILQEKGVECRVEYIAAGDDPARLGELNPYGETPILQDRDLVLHNAAVIIEYLDERFPHPPLMPVEPIARAKTRLAISRLNNDWLQPISALEDAHADLADELKREIHDGLLALSPLFAENLFFSGAEYTLADAYITPLLWRLPALGIELPRRQADALLGYGKRMFTRRAFLRSLSPQEIELRRS